MQRLGMRPSATSRGWPVFTRPSPILVTGMPRSGTTWLARLLATATGASLAGREPMNPRGRQYGLAGTVDGWTELIVPTTRQRRALWTAFHGLNPLTYSRYGRRQWAGPLPWTRLIVKDPFAVLSVPAVAAVTRATTVMVYRHPGASLASYRRMGWEPDLDELRPVLAAHRGRFAGGVELPRPGEWSEAAAMGAFWAALYGMALDGVVGREDVIITSHEELSAGGGAAGRRLFEALGLEWTTASEEMMSGSGTPVPAAAADNTELHNFDRRPEDVADAWRRHVDSREIAELETVTAAIHAELELRRFELAG